jgi:transposase
VQSVQEGESPEDVARVLINRSTIYNWLAEYRRGGWGALKAKPLFGRPPKLGGQKLQWIYGVVAQSPLQMKFDNSTSRGALLRSGGYWHNSASLSEAVRRALERSETVIQKWLNERQPRIKRRRRRTYPLGSSFGPHMGQKGRDPPARLLS